MLWSCCLKNVVCLLASVFQFTDKPEQRLSVLTHHFIRNPVRALGEAQDQPISVAGETERRRSADGTLSPSLCPSFSPFGCADSPEAWSEVNTLRLAYSAPKVPIAPSAGRRPRLFCSAADRSQNLCSVCRKDRLSTSCLLCRVAGKLTAIFTAAAATW